MISIKRIKLIVVPISAVVNKVPHSKSIFEVYVRNCMGAKYGYHGSLAFSICINVTTKTYYFPIVVCRCSHYISCHNFLFAALFLEVSNESCFDILLVNTEQIQYFPHESLKPFVP